MVFLGQKSFCRALSCAGSQSLLEQVMVKLRKFWDLINSSFWFVPALMTVIAGALSFFTVWLDGVLASKVAYLFGYVRGPEGARSLLSTVAGSIITVAGVVFSITIAALTLASSQFGPRLLRNFIRDKGNQYVLGTFVATFMYCLLVLRTINGSQENTFVPHISVTLGVVMAAASMGVFIYFIHHVSSLIQADNVISRVSADLHQTIERLFPEKLGQNPSEVKNNTEKVNIEEALPAHFVTLAKPIKALKGGYLQGIDAAKLLDLAKTKNVVFEVSEAPGQFFFEDMELTRVWSAEEVNDEFESQIRQAFVFGPNRTPFEDIDFALDQLVEVALRALSPGINDPFTAINCINSLGAGLAQLGKRSLPSSYRYDEQGQLRVVVIVETKKSIVDKAFDQIRETAHDNTAVTLHLLRTIGKVGECTCDKDLCLALKEQAGLIRYGSYTTLPDDTSRRKVHELYMSTISVLES